MGGLRTALWLIETPPADALHALRFRSLCGAFYYRELGQMAAECAIDARLATEMDAALAAIAPSKELWPRAMAGETRAFLAVIDLRFTRDERGNGWLVQTAQTAAEAAEEVPLRSSGPTRLQRSRLWNLASFLYNDRRTTETKVVQYIDSALAANALPYPEAVAALDELYAPSAPFNLLDGRALRPLYENWYINLYGRTYARLTRGDARRVATRLMLALGQYRAQHGRYPTALAELVPDFLDVLPPDPFGAPSFGYRLEEPNRYVLWSLGIDGEDDGGEAGMELEGRHAFSDHGDDIYTFPRGEPRAEPELVPANEGAAP